MAQGTLTPNELTLHGHRVTYRTAGQGPVLLLLHGIANSSQTWEHVAPLLSERFTLIAPDLLGHGDPRRRAATNRSARTPPESATSSPRSVTSA